MVGRRMPVAGAVSSIIGSAFGGTCDRGQYEKHDPRTSIAPMPSRSVFEQQHEKRVNVKGDRSRVWRARWQRLVSILDSVQNR